MRLPVVKGVTGIALTGALAFMLCSFFEAQDAKGDVWSRKAKDGTLQFTNTRPSGKAWKRVQVDDPAQKSKAVGARGACERCDKVPASDNSPERFHRYDRWIQEASLRYELPETLIRAVIKVESDYDPAVVSSFGARGLMQLMPAVVADMGVRDVHDPRENIHGGCRLLRVLANRYQGDLVKTIAAYHAGVGSLARYNDEVPPYFHTRKYLRMVMDRYRRYQEEASSKP